MSAMPEIIVAVLLLAGAFLALVAGIGLQRFESVYARMHAATKPATLGMLLVLAATAIGLGDVGLALKLSVIVLLQFMTVPIGAHFIARAAHRAGDPMGSSAVIDELREAEEGRDGSGDRDETD